MSFVLIDTHCHLHFPAFDVDREDVLERMRTRHIWGIVVGTSLGNSERAIRLAEESPFLWASIGLHPEHLVSSFHDAQEGEVQEQELDIDRLRLLASSPAVVAIGETGLDFYRLSIEHLEEEKQKQEETLREHIAVAKEFGLPVIFHCREAFDRLAVVLQEEKKQKWQPRGVIHSFTGSWDQAQEFLDLGLYVALNGIVTFPRKKEADPNMSLDRTIENMPLERLLLETDAPYLAPVPYRGKRNESCYVEEVAKYIARVRGLSYETVARLTTENATHCFHVTRTTA